jgi:hypothetical protein
MSVTDVQLKANKITYLNDILILTLRTLDIYGYASTPLAMKQIYLFYMWNRLFNAKREEAVHRAIAQPVC